MSLTKSDICKDIALSASLNINKSKEFFSKFIELLADNSQSKKIKLSNFGSFYRKKTKKRIGRNPKTLKLYLIDSKSKLFFQPSNKIKKKLN